GGSLSGRLDDAGIGGVPTHHDNAGDPVAVEAADHVLDQAHRDVVPDRDRSPTVSAIEGETGVIDGRHQESTQPLRDPLAERLSWVTIHPQGADVTVVLERSEWQHGELGAREQFVQLVAWDVPDSDRHRNLTLPDAISTCCVALHGI